MLIARVYVNDLPISVIGVQRISSSDTGIHEYKAEHWPVSAETRGWTTPKEKPSSVATFWHDERKGAEVCVSEGIRALELGGRDG